MVVSRLANSSCCGNVVRLSNLVGKTIEFRQFGKSAPQMGAKWTCPSCDVDYFVYWVRNERFWNSPEESKEKTLLNSQGFPYINDYQNQFVVKNKGVLQDTGYFTFILTFYYPLTPQSDWEICTEEEKTQLVRFYPDWDIK